MSLQANGLWLSIFPNEEQYHVSLEAILAHEKIEIVKKLMA
jgi:hypothetical protein